MSALPPDRIVPAHLLAAARDAQGRRERFEQFGSPGELDASIDGWNALLAHPDLAGASPDFKASVLNEAGMAYDSRFQTSQHDSDRIRSLALWRESVAETPLDSPHRFKRLNNLASGLSRGYDSDHRTTDLKDAAECLRAALEVAPAGWVGRGLALFNLGNVELSLHAAGQAGHALEDAVEHLREAASFTARGTEERVAVLDLLTRALRELYQATRRVQQLQELLASAQEVLRTAVEPPTNRSLRLLLLADDLREMYRRSGRRDALDAAISCLAHARELRSLAPPEEASLLSNLGLLLTNRFDQSGQAGDLEEAIDVLRRAAAAPAGDAASHAKRLSNLATALKTRYEHAGGEQDLHEALRLYREALVRTPEGSEQRPEHLDALSGGLIELYHRTGQVEFADQAIDLSRKALSLLPAGSPSRGRLLNNLANCLRNRYLGTGRLEDLDEALRGWDDARRLDTDDPAERAHFLSNMGAGLRTRYARTGAVEDLNAAVSVLNEALALTTPDNTERPWRLSNLGNALGDRYAATGVVEDLEKSIDAYRQAVAAAPASAIGRPRLLSNMGMGLRDLYRHTQKLEILDEAIDMFRQALASVLPDSAERPIALLNIGSSLRTRYGHSRTSQDLSEAISAYEEAATRAADILPEVALITSKVWSEWALERASFAEAVKAAGYGLVEVEKLLKAQYRRRHQEDWLFAARGVAANAAYAWANAGDPQRAVEILESNRAHFLSEALERNRHDLDRLAQLGHPELLDEYRKISAAWEALTAPAADGRDRAAGRGGPPATREQLEACRARLDAILDEIRQVAGYADFLRDPTFSQIQAAAASASLVYVVVTPAGGVALIVWSPQQRRAAAVDTIPLPSLTDSTLLEQVFGGGRGSVGYLGAYAQRAAATLTFTRWMNALDEATQWLWKAVMEPIVAAISQPPSTTDGAVRAVPSAVLIPSSLLGLLPLHAAWRPDPASTVGRRYALDDVNWSYAANARALAAARERSTEIPSDTLLIVADPQPVSSPALPNALEEAQMILERWPEPNRATCTQQAATYDEVTALLPKCDVLHYAGHAIAGWDVPLEGGLLLAGDRVLTVRELQAMQLRMRLAVLSACETGAPGARIPDEVIGLPTALVEAGVTGVVASLWSVPDTTTALLMEDFYIRWQQPELLARPGEALRQAQVALRDSGYPHPYHWAAFAYTGL